MTTGLMIATAAAAVSVLLTGFAVARFFIYCKTYRAGPAPAPMPVAFTITPFKSDGDETFERNLVSILEQDYGAAYTSIFVTHGEDDPGVPIVRRLMAKYPHAKLLIAGRASGCSQMIHNQLAALKAVPGEAQAIVVIDSDLRLRRDTLTQLVTPLADGRVGTTFGYPHYLPPERNLASLVRSFWNLCGVLYLVDRVARYPWGGLFALRCDLANRIDLHRLWGPCLTDDFPLGEAIRGLGLEQRFVPRTLLPAYEGGTPMSLIKWTDKRQTIMKVYHPAMWWQITVGLVGLHAVGLGALFAAPSAAAAAVALAWGGAEMVLFAALIAFVRRLVPESKPWTWVQVATLPVVAPLSLLLIAWNTAVSAVSRRVIWGGTVYRLVSPRDVRLVPHG